MTIHLLYFHSNRGQEGSMEKWRFNPMLSKEELEHRCVLSKSLEGTGPLRNTNGSEDPVINNMIHGWVDSDSSNNVDHLFGVSNIRSLLSDDTFFVRDSNGENFSIYFDIENLIFEIEDDHSSLSELGSFFSSYLNYSYPNDGSKSDNHDYDRYMYDTQYSWNNHITSCIENFLHSEIHIDSYISSNSDNYSKSYIYSYICSESVNSIDSAFRLKWNICEQCGYHLKMSSSERIELLIDPSTWDAMDEDMVSVDPIEFHSEEEPYKDRIDSYQKKTGLTEAVQTGIGQLNGISIAIGIMDFQFMGGSMGSVVGEKITRLIEYATNGSLPLIIVCASGGARMQEGSLSLMQMAKISSALYNYQSNKKLFYISILTSPTTGGVTASFGMLGDIIIAEPNAYIAFAGKRVIEQTLNKTVPDGSQEAEYLFHKGLFDLIVPRNLLKGVLSELFHLHGFFHLNKNEIK
nr:acetyl-CoA carboxylase beta subunit [Helleborus atrorubens]